MDGVCAPKSFRRTFREADILDLSSPGGRLANVNRASDDTDFTNSAITPTVT
jgi:hypothetical protein